MRPCYQLGSVGFSYGQTPGMSGQFGPAHAGVTEPSSVASMIPNSTATRLMMPG